MPAAENNKVRFMPLVCMQVNGTYDTQPRSYMSDIHPGVVEHRSFGVPVYVLVVQQATEKENDLTYKLDSHLLIIQEIGALENNTKRPFTNLLSHSVVDTHNIGRRGRHWSNDPSVGRKGKGGSDHGKSMDSGDSMNE